MEEASRVHVIYFLSQGGCTDQPHLFLAHQAGHKGVYLRDIKRWLADLRGKDMPEAFSWSYKRRYRTGYVWQDLVDDDLLTPISDNEYILKGSRKLRSPNSPVSSSHGARGAAAAAMSLATGSKFNRQQQSPATRSESSTLTDVSTELERQQVQQQEKLRSLESILNSPSHLETHYAPFNSSLLSSKKKMKQLDQMETEGSGEASPAQSRFTRSKRFSVGASYVLRNLISCGPIDTTDAFLVMAGRAAAEKPASPQPPKNQEQPRDARVHGQRGELRSCKNLSAPVHGELFLIGSFTIPLPSSMNFNRRKSFEGANSWKNRREKQRDSSARQVVSATYKPVLVPSCSQCGKSFKPENLHRHMKSCRGMKLALSTKFSAPTSTPPEILFLSSPKFN